MGCQVLWGLMESQEKQAAQEWTGVAEFQAIPAQRATGVLTVCQVSWETRDTEVTEESQALMVLLESQEKRDPVDLWAQEVNQVNQVSGVLLGQGDQRAHQASWAFKEVTVYRGQRAIRVLLEKLGHQVNKEIQERRGCQVLRVQSECLERRVHRASKA